jgi:hypothetical protein
VAVTTTEFTATEFTGSAPKVVVVAQHSARPTAQLNRSFIIMRYPFDSNRLLTAIVRETFWSMVSLNQSSRRVIPIDDPAASLGRI